MSVCVREDEQLVGNALEEEERGAPAPYLCRRSDRSSDSVPRGLREQVNCIDDVGKASVRGFA